MPQPTFLSISEQVAEHLRGELFRGRWGETIPGLPTLAAELGVNSKTVEVALDLLESQGAGQPRRIKLPEGEGGLKAPELRVTAIRGVRTAFLMGGLVKTFIGFIGFIVDCLDLFLSGRDGALLRRFEVRESGLVCDSWFSGAGSWNRDSGTLNSQEPIRFKRIFCPIVPVWLSPTRGMV